MPVTTIRGGRQINDGTIPYADIQTVVANAILGNNTASAATVSEITLAASTILGRGAGNITALSLGTGLTISGSTLQPTANLQSLAQLSYSSASFVKMTAAGTFALDTTVYGTGTVTSVALATGTTGTDVNITGSPITGSGTITLNIPSASTTARGLMTISSQTFAGSKTFNDQIILDNAAGIANYLGIKSGTSGYGYSTTGYVSITSSAADNLTISFQGATKIANFAGSSLTAARTYTLPNASGTLALTSDISSNYQAPLNGTGFVRMTGTTVSYITGTSAQFVKADGSLDSNTYVTGGPYLPLSGGTLTGQLITTLANNTSTGGGQIYLNGSNGNRIDFGTSGVAAPSYSTRSVGTKIVLYPEISPSSVDYALGIDNATLWFSIPTVSRSFKWYAGTNNIATLDSSGAATFNSTITVLGTTIQIRDASTNNGARVLFLGSSTAKNFLVGNQWTTADTFEITPSTTNGGTTFTTPALVVTGSGNVGIGITSPSAKLHIVNADAGSDGLIFQRWSYTAGSPGTYDLILKQTVTSGVVRYNFSMINNTTAYNNVLVLDRGNVGIGMTDPVYSLDINSSVGSGNIQVRLTQGFEKIRINTTDILGYTDGLWIIGADATATELRLSVGGAWDWDRQVQFYYAPGTTGAFAGVLKIGQTNKNNANYTHGVTELYTKGVVGLRLKATQQLQLNAYTSSTAFTGTSVATLAVDSSGNVITIANSGDGTVTSVSGTGTVSGLTLSGTVTSSGSLTLGGTLSVLPSNFAAYPANTVFAGPTTGGNATPSFRGLVAADIPALSYQAPLNGTGYVKMSGTTVSYVASIPNGDLANSSFYVGTTSISLGRASAAQSLTGITSIDGYANNIRSGQISNLNTAWTDLGTSISNGLQIFRYDSTASNSPEVLDNANWLMNIYSHPSGGTASYGHQISGVDSNNVYIRYVANGQFGAWYKIWTAATLTNLNQLTNGPGYITSSSLSAYLPLSGGTLTGALTISNGVDLNLKAATSSTDSGDIVFQDGTGAELHRLWNGVNTLNYRTAAGTTYQLIHTGNDTDFVRTRSTVANTNSSDFSTFTSAGTYQVSGNGTWTGSSNGPTSAYSYGQLVVTVNGSIVTQFYYAHATTGHWIRSKYNASDWQSWQRIWTDASLTNLNQLTNGPGYITGSYLPTTGGGYGNGNYEFASSDNSSTSYSVAAIELRETDRGASGSYLAPRLAFHWGNVVASQISIESGGRIVIRDNPGTGYQDFGARSIYAIGDRPIDINTSDGAIFIKGNTGGWATGMYFRGSGNTTHAGFGALGSADTFSYLWLGAAYNSTWLTLTSTNATFSTNVIAPVYYDSTTTYYLNGNVSDAWRIGTPSGYLDIGPMNSGYCHFQTDRATFYFNTRVDVNGELWRYNGSRFVENTGTWGINITGNAATVGNLFVHGNRNDEANKIVRTDGAGYIQAGWINTTSGDNGTTAIDRIYASSDGYIRYYTPANFRSLITDGVYVYSRNRTNWNDNTVIGNVVGQLAWKNYGGNHTIFDASAGTSPDGTAINNTNPGATWIASYPTLMGWNGTTTYGVRVEISRYSEYAYNSDKLDGLHASDFALLAGSVSQSFAVLDLGFSQTQYNPSAAARTVSNPMSFRMWDNYFAGTGLGSDYGTVLDFYGRSGHTHTHVYFDAGGAAWYRTAAYAAAFGSWQRFVTNSGTWDINITGTANNITQYTVNQNVGTGNTPTFYQTRFSSRISIGDGNGTPFLNTGSPGVWLSYNGGSDIFMGAETSTQWGVYIGAWRMTVNNSGTLTVGGDVIAYGTPSDARLKTIKEVIQNPIEKVKALTGYRFDWNKTDSILNLKEDIGVIAQEVADVLPELARTNDNGYMSVRYQGLTAVLIEAVKEQQKQIEDLKKQIEFLAENR